MRTSDEINEIAAALALAQGEIGAAAKDSANPHFKSRYADFASVRAAIQGPLSKHGIAYMQFVRAGDHYVEVETMLAHKSGQYMAETLRLPVAQMTPQAIGSATTYGRRYGLQSIAGVPADDDDGEAAMGRGVNKPIGSDDPITDDQARQISLLLTETKSNLDIFLKTFGVKGVPEITAKQLPGVLAKLNAKRATMREPVDA